MRNLDPKRARWIRLRMGVLATFMAVGLGVVVSAAYRVQVDDGPMWKKTAENQRQRRLHIEPKRGTLSDRNGTLFAVSVEVPSLSVDVAEMLVEPLVDRRTRGTAVELRPQVLLRSSRCGGD